jgi:MFS transporter, DHA1 family, inner membrane transport protein
MKPMQGGRRTRLRAAATSPSLVLFLALLASQAGVLVLTPILVEVAREFDVSTAAAGQLRMIGGLVAGVVALAFGRIGRRFALRDLLLVGAALLAFGSLASALAPTFAVLAVAQVPIGVAVAVLVSAGTAAAGEWAPGSGRGVLSWTLIGPAAAWVIGMPLVGLVAEQSWRIGFLVFPLIASLTVGVALALCPKEELPPARSPVGLGRLLADRFVGLWVLAELLSASAWVGTLVYAGALFVQSYGTSPAVTGLILAGVAVVYIAGNIAGRRLLLRRAPLDILPGLVAASAVVMVLLGVARVSVPVSAAVFALLAFIIGARTLASGTVGLETDPGRRLAVMGLRTAANQFGYFLGAATGGIALAIGGFAGLGIFFALLFIGATAALLALRSSRSLPAT